MTSSRRKASDRLVHVLFLYPIRTSTLSFLFETPTQNAIILRYPQGDTTHNQRPLRES
jgi:hypothetical protein